MFRLENEFWRSIKEIAGTAGVTVSELITSSDANRTRPNLSSALRVYVLEDYQKRAGSTVESSPQLVHLDTMPA